MAPRYRYVTRVFLWGGWYYRIVPYWDHGVHIITYRPIHLPLSEAEAAALR